MKNISDAVNATFKNAFGDTPLSRRKKDILKEATELFRANDPEKIREEAGDTLASLVQLCKELGWDPETLITETLQKIKRREPQYKTMGRKTNVAIFGGAFNPPTIAHIQICQLVLDSGEEIDEVWLLPCFQHNYHKKMAPARHRIKMCEIAARHDIRIKASSYEIDHRFRGETYHLLKKLLAEDFNDTYHFSWIIGLDNAIEFDKWAHPEELKEMIGFIIIPRFGVPYIPSPNDWFLRPPHIYLALDMENYPLAKVSSTMARESVAAKNWEGVSRIVAPEVLAYIRKNRLYLPR